MDTDSKQVLWRKDEKHFEKRVKIEPEIVYEEGNNDSNFNDGSGSEEEMDGKVTHVGICLMVIVPTVESLLLPHQYQEG